MCFDLKEVVVSVLCGHTACVQINKLNAHNHTVFLAILFYLSNRHLWERDLRLLVGENFFFRVNSSQMMNMQACAALRKR